MISHVFCRIDVWILGPARFCTSKMLNTSRTIICLQINFKLTTKNYSIPLFCNPVNMILSNLKLYPYSFSTNQSFS